ncbi:hypothetical protein KKC88_05800 [Patescibacteria group bacterium]|nr:hypothetical protein [Patescibacteria group bacterium]MBU1673635.1 hypothetical protein [Patescibacteria group bacterium]MBU1963877.1 hypothetical protein [Patescibacteria group bacterium]
MKKILPKAIALAAAFSPLAAIAQTDLYSYSTTSNIDDAAAGAAAAGLGIGMIILWILMMAVGLFFLIFWIIMLIDCVKREFDQRGTWLAIMIISIFVGLSWLAAILYYFLVKRKNLGTKGGPKKPEAPAAPKQEE